MSERDTSEAPAGPGGQVEALDAAARLRRQRAHWLAWVYAAAAVVLLPWIAYLAVTLPTRNLDYHYRAAWVGFDVFLVVVLARTAYMAFRVDQRIQFAATATATLLVVDAWFDVTTSNGRGQMAEALILAACFEIPAAILSLYVARQVNRRAMDSRHAGALAEGSEAGRAAERGRQETGPHRERARD